MKRHLLKLLCSIALVGAVGCDDGGGTDAGTDAGGGGGTDAGPRDAGGGGGTDAGPGEDAGGDPGTFNVRLAHNLPGLVGTATDVGAAHVCLWWFETTGSVVPGTALFATGTSGPIPFRGVSGHTELPVIAPRGYTVGFYDAADITTACPADPYAATAPTAGLLVEVPPSEFAADSFRIAVATGLLPDTFGATGGALPSICNAAAAAPTFMEQCTTDAQLLLFDDDQTAPAAGMTRIRVMNQVANSTPPSGFTVCYDPGLVPMPPPATGCADLTTTADQEALATGVAYGMVTEYADRAPIQPTGVPTAGVGGGLYLAIEDGSGCPDFTAGDSCYPILAAFPTMPEPLPPEIVPNLADGAIHTIFISGLLPPGAPFEDDFGVSFFVWHDNAP
ncbi:MAG: hypothetical protein AB7S26_27190 [Sandaracinaceae bacterium]